MGFLLAGLSLAVVPFWQREARAQGAGYSPDPYQPFNYQFQQFARPLLPNGGGPGSAGNPAAGRRDNQMQQYYDELEGAERAQTQRYGIGVQYWKMRSDIGLDKLDRLERKMGRRSEDTAASISQKYLAYFSEDSPRKRAILMREFIPTRRREAREGLARAEGETENGGRLRGAGGASAKGGDERTGRATPPAPPLSRFSGGSSRKERRPTDVLDRARRLDSDAPGSRTPGAASGRNRDVPPAPSPDE
jgi:hypothetical protein